MMENTFGNHQIFLDLFLDDFQNYFTPCQAIFLFKMFGLAYKKTSEMKESAPNKKTLKISTHNSQKQKS